MLLSFIIGCSKTTNEETEREKEAKRFYSFAEHNGKEWKGTASVINKMNKNSDSLLVGLAVYNDLGYRVQALNFVNLPITQDTIFLKPVFVSKTLSYAYYSTFLEDGDAVVEEYILNEKAISKNWVLIKKISDTDYSGTFNVNMVYYKGVNTARPDTLSFSKGSFLAKWRTL